MFSFLDIPLLPITGNKDDVESNFRLHWMNNKDMEFTMEAERLLQDLHQRLLAEEASAGIHSSNRTYSDEEVEEEEEDPDSEDGMSCAIGYDIQFVWFFLLLCMLFSQVECTFNISSTHFELQVIKYASSI